MISGLDILKQRLEDMKKDIEYYKSSIQQQENELAKERLQLSAMVNSIIDFEATIKYLELKDK